MMGSVYLAASSHERTLREMASRILASCPRRPLRVAATYAAAGGANGRMHDHVARLFDGAEVERFTVDGETDNRSGMGMPAREAISILERADVVFVGGGDPILGARRLVDAGADGWLRDARARGTACMGVSAGAMMLAAWWAEWPDHPPPGAPHDGGTLVRCTSVVPELVVDCHAEDDDWGELRLVRSLLRDRPAGAPQPRLLGLPTGQGIIVGPDGSTEDVGGAPFEL
jgi:cyanophycinase-like exopeptidase